MNKNQIVQISANDFYNYEKIKNKRLLKNIWKSF